MADGYFDADGNYIPGSFADQLDLPAPQGEGSPASNAAQLALLKAQKTSDAYKHASQQAQGRLEQLKQQLRKTPHNSSALKKLNQQIAAQQRAVTSAKARYDTSLKGLPDLQNKYYEASGQYEKLLSGSNRDAYAALRSMFNQFGLGTLAPKIYEFAKQGYGADVISLLLQDTKEYKQRFAANETRAKNGMGVLTPAEYLQTEQAYRQVLQQAGLPKGFYDSVTDFSNWIAGDVSPTEVKSRVDLAVANTSQANNSTVQALQQMYGVDAAHITAYFLDSKTALPLLQKQAQAAQFGGEALKRGLAANQGNLEDFVTAGLSQSQVSQGFQAVAEALPNIQALAARYGEAPFTQSELEQDVIGGQATNLGETRRKRLASQERSLFSGFSGASSGGLNTGFQQT